MPVCCVGLWCPEGLNTLEGLHVDTATLETNIVSGIAVKCAELHQMKLSPCL